MALISFTPEELEELKRIDAMIDADEDLTDQEIVDSWRREAAEQEARMEAYEKEMITFCNGNCANAKVIRQKDAETALTLVLEANRQKELRDQMVEARKREREQLRMEMERDATAMDAVRRFVVFCLVTALVTVWTPFPWWAAVALVVGTTALTAAYIFRVYNPVE